LVDQEAVTRSFEEARDAERARRAAFAHPIDRSADGYLVRRGTGWTIAAGYPWFTDWGRDTFIAMRGLCLAGGRLAEARDILVEWSGAVSEGMLPNRFPDAGDRPEYNSVDASLWFVVVVDELLRLAGDDNAVVRPGDRERLEGVVDDILRGFARGTRHGIRMDQDGLLAAGEPGWQLTWMDAKVGDRVITPRIGKPVEVQALWLNALAIGGGRAPEWRAAFERGREAFVRRFWNEERGYLNDVVDVDHVPGAVDATCRPNQILAVGGLPVKLLDSRRAGRLVDVVEARLLTPFGLRSLAREEAGYAPRYEGGPAERDAVYHQGAVWPWLMGPFIEAWVRVRGNTAAARRRARVRFMPPLLRHLESAGLGHVSELVDAEEPYMPRGCPFQAWSLGELMRVDRVVLGPGSGSDRSGLNGRAVPSLAAAMRVHSRLLVAG
jgi:predicted glycogen debranching enzyme